MARDRAAVTARRSTVFVDVGVSLDGYIAGPNRGPRNPLGDGGTSIHQWLFETASFREHLGLPGGATSPGDQTVAYRFPRRAS